MNTARNGERDGERGWERGRRREGVNFGVGGEPLWRGGGEGGGFHCSFINKHIWSGTYDTPRPTLRDAPFTVLQTREWEVTERERGKGEKRKAGGREMERGWTQVSHYPLGLFRGYSYKIIWFICNFPLSGLVFTSKINIFPVINIRL